MITLTVGDTTYTLAMGFGTYTALWFLIATLASLLVAASKRDR